MAAKGAVRIHSVNRASSDDLQRCGRATFSVRRVSPMRMIVAAMGELDAVNARALGRYVESHVRFSKQLIVDLRAVDFVGSQAFTALYYISVHCARGDVDWIILGGPPLRRMLDICDPEGELPLAEDLLCGLARLDRLAQCHYHVASTG